MEEVIQIVNSCLLTSKHGTTLDKLNKDYKLLENRQIPYQTLGFPTLEAFMRHIPSVRLTRRGSELWVEAIPTRESAHIARLVAGQRQSSARRRPNRNRQIPSRRPQAMSRSYDNNQPRFRSSNATGSYHNRGFGNNSGPLGSQSTNNPRPLMHQPVRAPIMNMPMSPPTTPRYTGSATTQMASPSKRMIERNIQPQQHLDYEKNSRMAMAGPSSSSYNPLATSSGPSTPTIANQSSPRREPSLTPVTPVSGVARLDETFPTNPGLSSQAAVNGASRDTPSATATPKIPRPTPPIAKTRLCDRLVVQNTSYSAVANGNSGIQVTFANTATPVETAITSLSPSQDPRDELRRLLRELRMSEPDYKSIPVVGRKGVASGYYGQVLVGSTKYSSYPEEAKTEKEAEILAARQAYAEIAKQRGSQFSLRQTTDRASIKERILAIVDEHVGGVFTHKIPDYYRQNWNENLPDDWLQDVAKWTEVETSQGVDNSTILSRRSCCGDPCPRLPTPKAEKVLLNPIGRVEPGILELPEEPFWVVHVPTVISTAEIWVRLVGEIYSDQFDDLVHDMSNHYATSNHDKSAVTIEVNGYYALKEDEIWHRVRIIEINDSKAEADVFFIDIGAEATVTTEALRNLDKKFCLLAAQATKVGLAYLEDFHDCSSIVPRIEKLLLDGIFYAEVLNREKTEDGSYTTVVFHDTNGPLDVNLNELISKKIIHQMITNFPRLEIENQVTEVHVSHVDENGDVFVQVKSEGTKFISKTIAKLTQNGINDDELKQSVVTTIDRTKIYFARCSTTGNWYRSRVIDVTNDSEIFKMFLIDYGRTMLVTIKNLFELTILSPFLSRCPAQAMKVRLHNVELSLFDEKTVARLVELAQPNELILLKVVTPSHRGSPPTVDLFKNIQPDNVLVSINQTLALEPELSKTNGDGNNNVRPRKRLERTNSRQSGEVEDVAKSLKPPVIAGIGEYFDVHVTMAANPGNFTVQPHAMTAALRKMMAELQTACMAHVGPHASLESIREGRLYAAKHDDGHWYRVCVSNVINEHIVTVYFCDYGDVTVITLDKLQKLQKKFLDLPYQAIKAKLVGIEPINKDWTPEDAYRFQKLVVERDFVSVVVESAPDRHSPGETVLGLKLIDVSTMEDINMGKLLVDEGRATFTD